MARTTLTREAIVDAALEVIDENGLDGLTMRSLAVALGVDRTAMYRHLRDKDELLEQVVDRLASQLVESAEDVEGSPWKDRAMKMTDKLRRLIRDRPGFAPLVAQGPISEQITAMVQSQLQMLEQAGIDDEGAKVTLRSALAYTIGFALMESSANGRPIARNRRDAAAEFWWATEHEFDEQFAAGLHRILHAPDSARGAG